MTQRFGVNRPVGVPNLSIEMAIRCDNACSPAGQSRPAACGTGAQEQVEMPMPAIAMGVIIILGVGFTVKDIALRVGGQFYELALALQHLAHDIQVDFS